MNSNVHNFNAKRTDTLYTGVTTQISDAGYIAPERDQWDYRMGDVWVKMKELGFLPSFNSQDKLEDVWMPSEDVDHPLLPHCQTRLEVADDRVRGEEMYGKLYVDNEPQDRPAGIVEVTLSDGISLPPIPLYGWKRTTAHFIAKDKGEFKGAPVVRYSITSESPEKDKEIKLGLIFCSSRTNEELNTKTDPQTTETLQFQLGVWYETMYENQTKPEMWSEEFYKVCDDYLKTKSETKGESKKSYRSFIIRAAFNDDAESPLGQTYDASVEEYTKVYESIWGTLPKMMEPSSEDSRKGTVLNWRISDNSQQLLLKSAGYMFTLGELGTVPTSRKALHVFTTVGALGHGTRTTNKEAIQKGRTNTLEWAKEYNLNPVAINGNWPIIKRILFVKQLTSGADYVAYEWCEETQDFIEKNN